MPEADHERWLTYRELGELLGCTANAARMHAHRRQWPHRAPNRVGDRARVLVPESLDVQSRASHMPSLSVAQMSGEPNGAEPAHEQAAQAVQALNTAVEALSAQLAIANRRIDELLAALADARTAAMISGSEAAALRAQVALLTDHRPWWRRWFR